MDFTNSNPDRPADPRPFNADHHFFWIESAFLAPAFRQFLSKSAWATYVLLCRRGSPRVCPDGATRHIAFSGVNDISETLGMSRAAAQKALADLKAKFFITARPEVPPPPGNHFLKGTATEVMLLPMISPEAKMSIPFTASRTIENILSPYCGKENRAIYIPSKLVENGKLRRLVRSWDAMRLAFRLYDLVDHSEFGAVSWTTLSVDAAFAEQPVLTIYANDVGNPALVGKSIRWLNDFDKDGYRDAARYRLADDLHASLGMTPADAINALIMLKDEGVIRWKCVIVSPDPEDADLGLGGYENTPSQYPWLEITPGTIPFIPNYHGGDAPERTIFVVTPLFQAQTSRVRAYRGARAKEAKEFRAWEAVQDDGESDE
ncbi:MAG: hypothetical protein HYX59_12880 [Elusimicrobia bacterium]|nr:hypothetical protein [Elusimicrobiota bacterium]